MFNYHIYVNRSPVPTLSRLNPAHAPILFLEEPIQYYPPIYAQVVQLVFFFHHISTPKPCMQLFSPLFVLHAPLVSFFLVICSVFGEQYGL